MQNPELHHNENLHLRHVRQQLTEIYHEFWRTVRYNPRLFLQEFVSFVGFAYGMFIIFMVVTFYIFIRLFYIIKNKLMYIIFRIMSYALTKLSFGYYNAEQASLLLLTGDVDNNEEAFNDEDDDVINPHSIVGNPPVLQQQSKTMTEDTRVSNENISPVPAQDHQRTIQQLEKVLEEQEPVDEPNVISCENLKPDEDSNQSSQEIENSSESSSEDNTPATKLPEVVDVGLAIRMPVSTPVHSVCEAQSQQIPGPFEEHESSAKEEQNSANLGDIDQFFRTRVPSIVVEFCSDDENSSLEGESTFLDEQGSSYMQESDESDYESVRTESCATDEAENARFEGFSEDSDLSFYESPFSI